ncbi:prepilin peptidase [Yoonia sp.]|uniref:prepilin peptidase n=1 Tax=Yoonia sp. TaxID=2212373 RepID=UPI002FD98C78
MILEYADYAMAALLVAATLIELRTGRIPNWLTILPLVLFVAVLALAEDRTLLYFQAGQGAAMFVLGLVLFAIGGAGAGAVKLLAGAALFVPFAKAFYTFLIFLGLFFVCAFLFVQVRKAFGAEDSKWHFLAKQVIPLSLPIAIAGIIGMLVI